MMLFARLVLWILVLLIETATSIFKSNARGLRSVSINTYFLKAIFHSGLYTKNSKETRSPIYN